MLCSVKTTFSEPFPNLTDQLTSQEEVQQGEVGERGCGGGGEKGDATAGAAGEQVGEEEVGDATAGAAGEEVGVV